MRGTTLISQLGMDLCVLLCFSRARIPTLRQDMHALQAALFNNSC